MTTIMQLLIHIRGGVSLVMSSVLAVGKHFRLGIILALACLACVLSYVPAVSQTSPTQLPNPLKIGVRTSVYPIGNKINVDFFTQFFPEDNFARVFYENKIHKPNSAEGFCGTFGKELQKELASNGQQIKVQYLPIVNQHKGVKVAPRYDGLKQRLIDIECGPNSISSGKLLTGQGIKFSNHFYETGVKLLLKEELAKKLNSGARGLNKITISVVQESTTLEVLQSIKDINQSKIATSDSGSDGLTDLEENNVQAFASDALIVGSLLREGVKGEPSDQLWWNIFNKRVDQPGQPFRSQYQNLGYTIYPNNSSKRTYLTSQPTEKYAMAVLEGTPFTDDLLNAINKTLEKSKLSSEGQKLKEYETRASDLSWNGWKKLLLFINTYIWVVFVPVIWALFIQFLSQILHESWVKTFTLVSGITVCLSLGLIVIIQIVLIVMPRVFPGY